MTEGTHLERTPLERAIDALLSPGRAIFALAIIGLGIETRVARTLTSMYATQPVALRLLAPIVHGYPSIQKGAVYMTW